MPLLDLNLGYFDNYVNRCKHYTSHPNTYIWCFCKLADAKNVSEITHTHSHHNSMLAGVSKLYVNTYFQIQGVQLRNSILRNLHITYQMQGKNAYFSTCSHLKSQCETPCSTEMFLHSCGTTTLTNSYESVFHVSYNEDPPFPYYE